jgi:hypothetical protein
VKKQLGRSVAVKACALAELIDGGAVRIRRDPE